MKNYIELIPAPQIILEQRHGHWFSTTICMSSKSIVDGPLDESYFNISAMT